MDDQENDEEEYIDLSSDNWFSTYFVKVKFYTDPRRLRYNSQYDFYYTYSIRYP